MNEKSDLQVQEGVARTARQLCGDKSGTLAVSLGASQEDFLRQLESAFAEWRSQFVTSKADRMGLRYPPMAFTEQGVAMLFSVPFRH